MDRIELLRTFLAVADTESFTAGAARLNISPQLASKYVRALEDDLGVQLFVRSTRRVSLTQTGAGFRSRSAQLVEDYDDLARTVQQTHHAPTGCLRLTAPTNFAEIYLVDALAEFAEAYPDVTVDLRLTDRFVDLLEDGVDVAIRIGELADSQLIARRIGPAELVVCAAPDYLAKAGQPKTIAELSEHSCILDSNMRDTDHWVFESEGKVDRVPVSGRFRLNSALGACRLALAGQGIVFGPTYVMAPHIASGDLVPVLPQIATRELGIYAIYQENRHLSTKIRVFVDFMATRFRAMPQTK